MKKIISVEDDVAIQEVLKLCFDIEGYEIEVFSDGTPVVNGNYELPDIFILDKRLPGMDGLDICKMLKKGEKTKAIPVIMLSADLNIKSLAEDAGAENSMEKPFSLMGLRKMVADYVN